jgi:hypothetical protein
MNNFQQDGPTHDAADQDRPRASFWPGLLIVVLIVVAALAIIYAHSQQSAATTMAAREASLNTNVAQLQTQLQSTTAKLNDMIAQQAAAEAAQAKARAQAVARRSARTGVRRRHVLTASEKRYNALQARIDAQQKELNDANNSIAQTRSDLQANLDSTRGDLNGSIAKNHTELVALEKRGQRNYFEFDLSKQKAFTRSGPISLELRHADTKHMRYNMMLLVDDNRLEKKNVDLYEPIWISSTDEPQPLEIVVNKISKNHIHGYISAPKYASADLGGNDSGSMKPVSATSSIGDQTASPQPAPESQPQQTSVQP